MLAENYTTVRKNLKGYIDKVNDDAETLIITRPSGGNAVLMSLDGYNNMMENIKIYQNPKYLMELYESIEQVKRGNIIVKTDAELRAMEE